MLKAIRIVDQSDEPMQPNLLLQYKNASYKRFYGDQSGTAHRTWSFLDESGNPLLMLIDMGNRNLVRIDMDGRSKLYLHRPPNEE